MSKLIDADKLLLYLREDFSSSSMVYNATKAMVEAGKFDPDNGYFITKYGDKIPKKERLEDRYASKWSQARSPYIFRRRFCPICGTHIPEDNGYGQMEIAEECPVGGSKHYSYASNNFGTWLHVGGNEYETTDTKAIDEWLDQVGNKEFR